jgi:hypothetical protein
MDKFPPIEKLSDQYMRDDLFVCALGFEDRCVTGPERLEKHGYICKNAIMLKYDVHEQENDKNREKLRKILENIGVTPFLTSDYSVTDPFKSESKFVNTLNMIAKQPSISSVTIDITSFSSASIIQILDLLFYHPQKALKKIRIIYTDAEIYFPLKKDIKRRMPEDVHLSSGVKEVITIPGFSGIFLPGYSTLLIIFLGFDPIRARGAINFFQPSQKIGIVGDPPQEDRKWRADEVTKRNLMIFDEKDEIILLSTSCYEETILKLNELYENFSPKSNIAICPLGSKLQTLGVFLFAKKHPDVKLLFPIPMKFHPKRYSKGYTKTWQIIFELKNNYESYV